MSTAIYFLVGAGILWFVGSTFMYQVKLRRRRGLSREEFIAAFRENGIPEKIPAAVYDYYRSIAFGKGYAVAPDDRYEELLRAGPEEIDDDAVELLKTLRLQKPTERAALPLATIRDMVLWLNWASQHQPQRTGQQEP